MSDEDKKCPMSILAGKEPNDCIGSDCQIWLPAEPITRNGGTELELPEGCGIKRELRNRGG